jgi:hypothetical protein
VRLRLIYSPLYKKLRWLRPLEIWLYRRLRAPVPVRDRRATAEQLQQAANTSAS